MIMEKLLVCVDGSDHSEDAVRYAVELWKKFGSTVTLLYVWPPPSGSGQSIVFYEIPAYDLEQLKGAEDILREAGVPYTLTKHIGNPAMHIIEESKKGHDLVLMGSRGLGSVEGFLLGSVTSRVAHHVHVPLLIVPPHKA